MATICILGRQPAIGLAELESLYGASLVTPIGEHAAIVDAEINFERLGGTVKSAKHLTTLDTTKPQKAFDYCRQALPEHIQDIPDGKIKLGISLYGLDMPLPKHNANVLSLKKIIKQSGRSVRAVPNTESALSSAQTYHNGLVSPVGLELVFIRDRDSIVIGQVNHVQDIDSYTLRDRGRPKRDAFVGMLPPKLAQVIINFAVGQRPASILDPFCGTGVILQEASLMGYDVIGTDISPKMIDYSRTNLEWLRDKFEIQNLKCDIAQADATAYKWWPDVQTPTSHIHIATEGYLGQPIGGQKPTAEKLQEIIHDSNSIMRGFLRNIAPQLPSGTRLCIAAPAWYIDSTMHHLPVIDEIESLGFERIVFTHATFDQLVYRRDDQPTGRELLVLIRT